MAALRATIVLDRDEKKVSFQGVHRRLKSKAVQVSLRKTLAERHGLDETFPPTREELIVDFLATYAEIEWKVHSRLVHFRNAGIAHLTVDKVSKSVTFDELRKFVSIISRLATTLQQLCYTPTAFQPWMLEKYSENAQKALLRKPPLTAS